MKTRDKIMMKTKRNLKAGREEGEKKENMKRKKRR